MMRCHIEQERVHAYLEGWLSPEEATQLEAHLQDCKACQAHRIELTQLSQEVDQELAMLLPTPETAAWDAQQMLTRFQTQRQAPLGQQRPPLDTQAQGIWQALRQLFSVRWLGAVAAAAVVLLVLVPGTRSGLFPGTKAHNTTTPAGHRLIPKGQTPLITMLHAHKSDPKSTKSRRTRDGQRLHPGDLIQLLYRTPKRFYVMFASLNHKGSIAIGFPLGGQHSAKVEVGSGTLPPGSSLELDDTLGAERFFVFYAPKPFSAKQVKRALRAWFAKAQRDLHQHRQLPGPWRVKTLLIHKQRRPQTPREQ